MHDRWISLDIPDMENAVSPHDFQSWDSALVSAAATTYVHGDLVLFDPFIHHAVPPLLGRRYLPNGLLGLRSLTNRDASHLDLNFGRFLSPSATALVGIFPHVFFKRRQFPALSPAVDALPRLKRVGFGGD